MTFPLPLPFFLESTLPKVWNLTKDYIVDVALVNSLQSIILHLFYFALASNLSIN